MSHDKVDYRTNHSEAKLLKPKPSTHEDSTKSLVATISLPKIELDKFDGNPRKFWKFTKGFQVNVANRIPDNTQRLMYLIYCCSGEAKRAIEDCVLLPDDICYDRAVHILHQQFGRPHDIAESFINNLLSGGSIAADDVEGLQRLVRDMSSCEMALSQMNYTADLNCSTNLKKIVYKLPRYLQREWARCADETIRQDDEPSFRHLIEFLENQLSIMTNVYGRLASGSRRGITKPNEPERSIPASRSGVNTINLGGGKCQVCLLNHQLHDCQRFRELSLPEKVQRLKENKLCFNCFKPNHRAGACRSTLRCNVENCGRRHHRLIHSEATSSSNAIVNSCSVERPSAYLGFVPIRLIGQDSVVEGYALLDGGSDTTLVSKKAAKQAGLHGTNQQLQISSINGTTNRDSILVSLTVESIDRTYRTSIKTAYIVDQQPVHQACLLPVKVLKEYTHLDDIEVARLPCNDVILLVGTNAPDFHWTRQQFFRRGTQPFAS